MSDCVVVTGAAGFIGRRLIARALAEGFKVRALCRRPDDMAALSRHPQLEIVCWDIREALANTHVLVGARAICHLAAYIPPDYQDAGYTRKCFEINVVGTTDLLEASVEAEVGRFIHFSSGNTYDTRRGSGSPLDEDAPLYPCSRASFYLSSKVAGETIVNHYREGKRLAATVLRVASCYGAGMSGGFMQYCLESLRDRKPVTLYEGGRHRADWVYIDDVVAATLASISRDAEGTFNIGSGAVASTLEVARCLAEKLGVEEDLIRFDPSTLHSHPNSFNGLDISRAREMLGYEPTSLETGVARLCDATAERGS